MKAQNRLLDLVLRRSLMVFAMQSQWSSWAKCKYNYGKWGKYERGDNDTHVSRHSAERMDAILVPACVRNHPLNTFWVLLSWVKWVRCSHCPQTAHHLAGEASRGAVTTMWQYMTEGHQRGSTAGPARGMATVGSQEAPWCDSLHEIWKMNSSSENKQKAWIFQVEGIGQRHGCKRKCPGNCQQWGVTGSSSVHGNESFEEEGPVLEGSWIFLWSLKFRPHTTCLGKHWK